MDETRHKYGRLPLWRGTSGGCSIQSRVASPFSSTWELRRFALDKATKVAAKASSSSTDAYRRYIGVRRAAQSRGAFLSHPWPPIPKLNGTGNAVSKRRYVDTH